MKKFFRVLVISLLTFSLLSSPALATTGVPSIITYQGNLTDSGGNTLGGAGTLYYFKFSFWDSPTVGSGTKLWPSSTPTATSLTVKRGVFSVNIGDTASGYPDTLNYDFNTNSKVYLQVEISSDNVTFETLSPRSLITSTPFTQQADRVVGTNQSSFGTTTPITNSLISAITTSINQVAMTIRGIAGQVANLFNIQDSNGNSLFTVTSGGNVGIGTTTPTEKLHIFGTSGTLRQKLQQTSSSGYAEYQMVTDTGELRFGVSGSGTSGGVGPAGDSYLLTFGAKNLIFGTNNTERMRISSGGNVGIGTTTPTEKLSVIGNVKATTGFIIGDGSKIFEDNNFQGIKVMEPTQSTYRNVVANAFTSTAGLFASYSTNLTLQSGGSRLAIADNGALVNIGRTNAYNYTAQTTIENTANGTYPVLDLRAKSDQSAPIMRWLDSSANAIGVISATGNIGIGTSTPGSLLTIGNNASINSSGFAMFGSGSNNGGNAQLALGGQLQTGFNRGSGGGNNGDIIWQHGGTYGGFFAAGAGIGIKSDSSFSWGNAGSYGSTLDLRLYRDASGVLAQRNGVNAQAFRLYDTYTDASNYSRLNIGYGAVSSCATCLGIGTTKGGAESEKRIALQAGGTGSVITLGTNGSTVFGTTAANNVTLLSGGNLGIGTTTPSTKLDIWGNLNVGTSSTPTLLANTSNGGIRFGFLTGAGANLIVDANGNVTVSSDERLKNIQNTFDRGLTDIEKINPIIFKWKPETGYDASSTYTGFSAQNIQSAIPEAVTTDSRGFLTLADRPILATLVNAVKELAQKILDMATLFKTKEVQTDKLCVGQTCLTEDQLKTLLQNTGSVGNSSPTPTPTPTPSPETPTPSAAEPAPVSEPALAPEPAPVVPEPTPVIDPAPTPEPTPTPTETPQTPSDPILVQ